MPDSRISLSASLRLPVRRLLRARREAHPIGDRTEAPVRARQRRRRCPPEPSTPMPRNAQPVLRTAAGRSFYSAVRVSPSCRARDISPSTSRRTSTPHAIGLTDRPRPTLSLHVASSPRTPSWRTSRGPGPHAPWGQDTSHQDWSPCMTVLCCVCGEICWDTFSSLFMGESLDCVEGGDV